jgi:pilus assembly protein CpaE
VFVFKIGCIIGSRELKESVQLTLQNFPGQLVLEDNQIESWGILLEKLERTQPDVLLLDLQQVQQSLEDTIKQVKSVASNPKVIVIHSAAEPNTILRCLRAGADEFLYPPLEGDLRTALDRIAGERLKLRAGTRPRGKVLGFLSAKGGCGATSAACHIGVELYRQTNLEVLVADFDLESGVMGFLMKSMSRYSLVDALDNIQRLDASFWKALVSNGIPGVEVIMAPQSGATNARVFRDPEDYRNIMRFTRANYDWTIADLGHGLGYAPLSLLEEIDSLFLLTTLEVPALHQAKVISTALLDRSFPSHRLHIVLNRMPKRSDLALEELEAMIGQPIYATLPNDYVGLNNAYSEGLLAAPNSLVGRNYARVAAKIAGVESRPKKRFSLF